MENIYFYMQTFLGVENIWHESSIVVCDDDGWALQPLGLVGEEVAPLVVGIVGHHQPGGDGPLNTLLTTVQLLYYLGSLAAWGSTHVQNLRR